MRPVEKSPAGASRDHAVPCRTCLRPTFNHSAVCWPCIDRSEQSHGWDHADDERFVRPT